MSLNEALSAPHLKPASILLYEVIIHSADHPLVLIQDLSLQVENGHVLLQIFLDSLVTLSRLTGCMLINQPVFSPGSFIRSNPKRVSISSVNWLRSSLLRADIEDPSSL